MADTVKGVEIDPVRERIVELIQSAVGGCSSYWAGLIADSLIANGVTVKVKKDKPPVDLTGKCGSCVYASSENKRLYPNTRSYVQCLNPERKWYREISAYRARTTPCCKKYKPKEECV